MGNHAGCEKCDEVHENSTVFPNDPAFKDCQQCKGLDVLAPSQIVVQSFGLPASHSNGRDPEYESAKIPNSSASDWHPGRGKAAHDFDDEFYPTEGATENISGNPQLQDSANGGKGSPTADQDAAKPKSASAAPKAAPGPLQNAPMPMVMQEVASPQLQAPLEPAQPAKPVKKMWRQDATLHEVLEETCWCWYCICYGCGFSKIPTHPKCTCDCICCRSMFESSPCFDEGCCQCVNHCGCCTFLVEYPGQERTPCCLFCGDPCLDFCPRQPKLPFGKVKQIVEGEHEGKGPTLYEGVFLGHDTCFCCCAGCGQCCVPDCEYIQACCCSRCQCRCQMPTCERGCCNCLLTWAWLYGQCWLPPQYGYNPCCAAFGLRCHQRNADRKNFGV